MIILVASGLFATVYLLVLQNFGWFAALVVAFLTAPIVSWVITKRIRGG